MSEEAREPRTFEDLWLMRETSNAWFNGQLRYENVRKGADPEVGMVDSMRTVGMGGSGSAYYDACLRVFDMATSRTGSESAHAVVLLCSGVTFIWDDMITCDTELLVEEFERAGCSVERDFDDVLRGWGYRVSMPGRVGA